MGKQKRCVKPGVIDFGVNNFRTEPFIIESYNSQVNLEIVRAGMADPLTIPPNSQFSEVYA